MAELSEASAQIDPALQRVMNEINRLNLQAHLVDLETQGYTVLKQVLNTTQIERAQQAILERFAKDSGHQIDLSREDGSHLKGQTYIPYLLYEDEIFEDILLAPVPLALITYLLGESCLLSIIGCHLKGPGGDPLGLHSDNGNGMPAPFSPTAQVANINYALTPYSREAGALAMVPGSHKLARQPTARETRLDGERANPKALSMDLAPGDAVVWHGNTWHGSFARTLPGVRMNLAVYFNRQYIQTQEQHRGVVPESVCQRHANNPRFQVLLGSKQPYGWQHQGPDYKLMAQNPRGLYD